MKETMFLIVVLTIAFLTGLYFFVEVMSTEVWTRQTWRELTIVFSCFGAFGYTVFEIYEHKTNELLESITGE